MIRILVEGMSRNLGGMEKFIMTVYEALDKEKYHMDFLVYDPTIAFEEKLLESGSQIYRITPRSQGVQKSLQELDELFSSEHFDVFWSNRTTISNINALSVAEKHSVPTRIIYSHCSKNMGSWFTYCMHMLNRSKVKKLATHLAACSQGAADWFYGKEFKKAIIINNGLDISKYLYSSNREKEIRKVLDLKDEFVVGHVGRLSPEKNHIFLFRIFSEIIKEKPNSVLLLCGDGNLKNSLEEEAKKLNIFPYIRFLGRRDDIDEILQCVDAFVFPSLFEGFPISLIESQAAGIPSFCSEEAIPANIQIEGSNKEKKDYSKQLEELNLTIDSMIANIKRFLLNDFNA